MLTKILVAGTSVRAQVKSAQAAGFEVHAFDLFADWDAKIAFQNVGGEINQLNSFSQLPGAIENREFDLGLVSGGVESRIELVSQIESKTTLLGPNSTQLAKLLEKVLLNQRMSEKLSEFGVMTPRTLDRLGKSDGTSDWLRKNYRSAGGLGVELLDGEDAASRSRIGRDSYFQAFTHGESISVVYVSEQSVGRTIPLGITKQLVNIPEFGGMPFRYCGSIGPLATSSFGNEIERQIILIGNHLANDYQLQGIWGVDFILNQQGAWPVDVNPRLTASTELFESRIAQSTRFKSVIDLHAKACGVRNPNQHERGLDAPIDWRLKSKFEGKAILFNDGPSIIEVTSKMASDLIQNHDPAFFGLSDCPFSLADIPNSGVSIKPGQPILTIRVRRHSLEEVEPELISQAKRIYRLLGVKR